MYPLSTGLMPRLKRRLRPSVGMVFLLVLASTGGCFFVPKSWTGIRMEGTRSSKVGTYRSLDACRTDVEQTGGSCGKDCREYDAGLIADCNPLVDIPKK